MRLVFPHPSFHPLFPPQSKVSSPSLGSERSISTLAPRGSRRSARLSLHGVHRLHRRHPAGAHPRRPRLPPRRRRRATPQHGGRGPRRRRGRLLRLQDRRRRLHLVRRRRARAAPPRPGPRHGRQQVLLLRPRALAGPLAHLLRRLLRPLLADVRYRGAVPAGGVGPERVPHQVQQVLRQRPAPLRDAAQGRLRRRRRLRVPHRALRRAPLHLLLQGPRCRRGHPTHHPRRRHRHDPHLKDPCPP